MPSVTAAEKAQVRQARYTSEQLLKSAIPPPCSSTRLLSLALPLPVLTGQLRDLLLRVLGDDDDEEQPSLPTREGTLDQQLSEDLYTHATEHIIARQRGLAGSAVGHRGSRGRGRGGARTGLAGAWAASASATRGTRGSTSLSASPAPSTASKAPTPKALRLGLKESVRMAV